MEDRIKNLIYEELMCKAKGTDLFFELVSSFPHPIQVYNADGVLVLVNSAFVREFQIQDPGTIIGKYNLFEDPTLPQCGTLANIESAYSGKVIFACDIKVPVNSVKKILNVDIDEVRTVLADILTIPIMNQEKQLQCIVNILMTKGASIFREEIHAAIQYIESHWREEFDIDAISEAAHLSPAHFSRLFKENTGKSPHEYYVDYKLQRVKEKLLDTNLSVAQAFEACGLSYHSHYAKIFKEKTGYSPSEYRKTAKI